MDAIKQALRGFGIRNKRRNQNVYITALQAYFDFKDSRPEQTRALWGLMFKHAKPTITIPMYLCYIEGWSHQNFCDEFEITSPTYYRWVTSLEIPRKYRNKMIEVMDDIEPFDLDLFLQARDNEQQWSTMGKTRTYKPSKKLTWQSHKDMKARGYVDCRDYGKNYYRVRMQLMVLAKNWGWVEEGPGIFIPDPDYVRPHHKRVRVKTMDQINGD